MAATHVNPQVQEVKGARIRGVFARDFEMTGGKHGHEQVCQVQHGRAEYLLRDVKRPHLYRPLGPFPPPLVDERQQGQGSERGLHEEREGPQEPTFPVAVSICIVTGVCADIILRLRRWSSDEIEDGRESDGRVCHIGGGSGRSINRACLAE